MYRPARKCDKKVDLSSVRRKKFREWLTFVAGKSAEFLEERHGGSFFSVIKRCLERLTECTRSNAIRELRSPTAKSRSRGMNERGRSSLASVLTQSVPRAPRRTTHASRTLGKFTTSPPRWTWTRYVAFPLNSSLSPPCRDHDRTDHYVRALDRECWRR